MSVATHNLVQTRTKSGTKPVRERLGQSDELTGLANRRLLFDRFSQASSLANRQDQSVALSYYQLNEFKSVTDTLGHDAGDKLLQQVALRLTNAIRGSDTACRYGGVEFIVLLTEINRREDAVKALKKIRVALASPFVIGRYSVRLDVSNGMALYPNDTRSFADLVRIADRSMFGSKSGSQGGPGDVPASHIWLHSAEGLV